jgi:hypothetical protein
MTKLVRLYPLPVEDWSNDKAFMCLERIVQAQNLAYGYDALYAALQQALDEFRSTFPEVWDQAIKKGVK